MLAFRRLMLMRALYAPVDDVAGGGGGAPPPAGGGTGEPPANEAPPPRMYSEEQVNRIVTDRLAKAKRSNAGGADEAAQIKARAAELEAELEELRGKVAPSEQAQIEANKAARRAAQLEADLNAAKAREAELSGKLGELTTRQKSAAVSDVVRKALATSGAHTPGLEQAVRLMVSEGSAELDEDGVTITIDRVPYTGEAAITKAAAAWLLANPHFQKSTDGGSGGRRPNGGGVPLDMDKMPAASLISRGLRAGQ